MLMYDSNTPFQLMKKCVHQALTGPVPTLFCFGVSGFFTSLLLIAVQGVAFRQQALPPLSLLVSSPVGSYSVCFAHLCTQVIMVDQK